MNIEFTFFSNPSKTKYLESCSRSWQDFYCYFLLFFMIDNFLNARKTSTIFWTSSIYWSFQSWAGLKLQGGWSVAVSPLITVKDIALLENLSAPVCLSAFIYFFRTDPTHFSCCCKPLSLNLNEDKGSSGLVFLPSVHCLWALCLSVYVCVFVFVCLCVLRYVSMTLVWFFFFRAVLSFKDTETILYSFISSCLHYFNSLFTC